MKKFIFNGVTFSLASISAITLLVLITGYLARANFDFKIPPERNVLVLGNSHPECAIDDSISNNMFNLAQSGSGYFYDYLKAKKVLKNNPQIDTLILGYSYGDLAEDMNSWFNGDEKIKFKIRNHFFLFSWSDYWSLFCANPLSTLEYTPQTIYHNLKVIKLGFKSLGGYKRLTRTNVSKEIQKEKNEPSESVKLGFSKYQKKYLLKLYEICESNDIQLVLLTTPMHELKIEKQARLIDNYCSFAKDEMPRAILIDYADYLILDEEFADMAHLNFKGAEKFTNYLVNDYLSENNNCKTFSAH